MIKRLKNIFLLLVCLGSVCISNSIAKEVPPLTGPVVDLANVLSNSEVDSLGNSIRNFYANTNSQLQVLIVDTLDGEDIEGYSIKVAEKWKIGSKEGTGVILLVAVKDRKMRIEVGQGAEGAITDSQAGKIISDIITPEFREGNYYKGISLGLVQIANYLGGEFHTDQRMSRRFGSKQVGSLIFFFLFLILAFSSIIRRGGGGFLTGILLGTLLGGGRSGGGWSGGGGGGGWSGGGGGFSGGGASGSW